MLVVGFFSLGGSLEHIPFTGKASDSTMFLCINDPPVVSISGCPASINQTTSLIDNVAFCNVSVVEPENESYTIMVGENASWVSYDELTGRLSLRPRQEQVGVQNVSIVVTDASGCSNGEVDDSISLDVLDVNDPPEYAPTIPAVEFQSGNSVAPFSLFTYFSDPDNDVLNLSVFGDNVVSVSITQASGLAYFSSTGCGADYVFFRATDPEGLFVESGIVRVESLCTDDSSGGGGGGGGGAAPLCTPQWQCREWSECLMNGSRSKTCIDLHGCKANDYQRVFWEECDYIPTCFDGVKNQGETGIDCGGPCRPCGTCFDGIQNNDEEGIDCGGAYCEACTACFDGIQNWDETGIDCGGSCDPCPTCFDGVKNQNETGIDCGGPFCPACAVGELPAFIPEKSPLTILLLSLGVLLLVLLVLFKFFHKQFAAGLARIAMAAMQRKEKLILLSGEQKEEMLAAIESLSGVLGQMRKVPSSVMDELVVLTRRYFVAAIGMPFAADSGEALGLLAAKVKRSSLQKSLAGFFSSMRRFEQTGKGVTYDACHVALEELRLFVLLTSQTSKEDLVHEVDEKEIAGSGLERFDALFFNLLLTLQFGERGIAREQYMKLLGAFERLDVREQQRLYDRLHRAYEVTKYALSLR